MSPQTIEKEFFNLKATETAQAKQVLKQNDLHFFSYWLKNHDSIMEKEVGSSKLHMSLRQYLKELNINLTCEQARKAGRLIGDYIRLAGLDVPSKAKGSNQYSTKYLPLFDMAISSVLGVN